MPEHYLIVNWVTFSLRKVGEGDTFRFDFLHAKHAVETLFFHVPLLPLPPASANPALPPPLITEVDDSPVGLGRPDADPGPVSSEVGDGPGASWRYDDCVGGDVEVDTGGRFMLCSGVCPDIHAICRECVYVRSR